MNTYRWIAGLPDDLPLDEKLIRAIHFRIVSGADDDHCQPGQLRKKDENVTFGTPRHRGVEGGEDCVKAFAQFASVLQREFQTHDPLIQALAAHYHLAAMHPFLDGNGRTARAMEALLLQRAGLRDACFIAMSNYYYDEKTAYLSAMSEVRALEQDLTPFLKFALKGVALQTRRLLAEIKHENAKALFRNLMYDLFSRLKTPRKRVIAKRQIAILNILLDSGWIEREAFADRVMHLYKGLGNPGKAISRDLNNLFQLGTIRVRSEGDRQEIGVKLEWPTEITATEFFKRLKQLPKAKGQDFFP
ncbi:MAG: Fic family protein [Acidobacteria bacterium]|nr:Fic family protein [Acidobacteriota bacterium]